ncbi:MAG: ABC transporter substrate-binding protein, partial [Anaerolineae bacterium]
MNMSNRNFLMVLFLLVGALLGVSACASATPTRALTPITMQLKYLHQAQFAGFYAADQNGYYAAEGLKVNFIEGGPTVDLKKAVLDGTAQFGLTAPEVMIAARAQG